MCKLYKENTIQFNNKQITEPKTKFNEYCIQSSVNNVVPAKKPQETNEAKYNYI